MKRILSIVAIFITMSSAIAQANNEETKQLLKSEANQIVQALKLDISKEKLVYNVLYHVQTRIEDLALGTPNYDRLIGYIDEERTEMMKAIMPTDTYKEYIKLYNPTENLRIQKLKEINKEYNSTSKEEALMQREKILAKAF